MCLRLRCEYLFTWRMNHPESRWASSASPATRGWSWRGFWRAHPRFSLALAVSDKWAGDTVGDHLPVRRPDSDGAHPSPGRGGDGHDRARTGVPLHAGRGVARAGARRRSRPGCGSSISRAPSGSPWMNIHAGTGSPIRAPTFWRAPATRCRRRGARATSGRPSWSRTLAATRRPARWRRWPSCAAASIAQEGIVIDAKSGTTGAGRKASEEMSFTEVDGDFRAYRVLKHQHTPEIERTLALAGARRAARHLHASPPAHAARDPGDGLRPPAAREDWRGRRGGHQGVRRRSTVLAGDEAGGGAPARGGRHEPRAAWRPTPIRSAASPSPSPPSTTWSRARPGRRSRTPT